MSRIKRPAPALLTVGSEELIDRLCRREHKHVGISHLGEVVVAADESLGRPYLRPSHQVVVIGVPAHPRWVGRIWQRASEASDVGHESASLIDGGLPPEPGSLQDSRQLREQPRADNDFDLLVEHCPHRVAGWRPGL